MMESPKEFERIINSMRYSVENAALVASDAYWDGHNFERKGRNTFLYRTKNGAFFTVKLTKWEGEQDTLTPVCGNDATDLYEYDLTEHEMEYAEAFPDVEVRDA